MERPTSGSRTIKSMLDSRGRKIARSRVVRLMRLMGLRAIYPIVSRGRTQDISLSAKRHEGDPGNGGHYVLWIVAVIGHSRKALAHRLSNTMDAAFCVEAMEEAIVRYGAPQVFNTDQKFTSDSRVRSRRTGCASLWTARAAGWTMCTWSALAQPQAGRSLPARLRDGERGQEGNCRLPALLQRRASSPGT